MLTVDADIEAGAEQFEPEPCEQEAQFRARGLFPIEHARISGLEGHEETERYLAASVGFGGDLEVTAANSRIGHRQRRAHEVMEGMVECFGAAFDLDLLVDSGRANDGRVVGAFREGSRERGACDAFERDNGSTAAAW